MEPSGPLNVGSIARLCKNFGVSELRLVSPKCNVTDKNAQLMAVKGGIFLTKAKIYSSLINAIGDCPRVIATSGRIDHGNIPLLEPENAINWFLDSSDGSAVALVFGREDSGLTNQELLLAQKVVTLKTIKNYRSLNLSHAVAIVLHEIHRCEEMKSNTDSILAPKVDPALPLELNNCIEEAEKLLLEIGFLYKHTSKARISKIRALLQRSEICPSEVAMIRGIVSQVRWALDEGKSSTD